MKDPASDALRAIAFLLSGTLALAVASKILRYSEFTQTLIESRLVPGGMEILLAPVLLAVETVIALGLLMPRTRPRAFGGALLLSGLFFGYHAWAYRLGLRAPCSCFGLLFRMEPAVGAGIVFGMGLLAATGLELARSVSLRDAATLTSDLGPV
jgi:hypothetical protein